MEREMCIPFCKFFSTKIDKKSGKYVSLCAAKNGPVITSGNVLGSSKTGEFTIEMLDGSIIFSTCLAPQSKQIDDRWDILVE